MMTDSAEQALTGSHVRFENRSHVSAEAQVGVLAIINLVLRIVTKTGLEAA